VAPVGMERRNTMLQKVSNCIAGLNLDRKKRKYLVAVKNILLEM
jgi:hypothetical protein